MVVQKYILNTFQNPKEAVKGADVLITDTWFSMGDKEESNQEAHKKKLKLLEKYQVNLDLMKLANQDAVFTHCLPAYRGFEVTAEVIDSKKSIVFEEVENRLHVQKAIMLWSLNVNNLNLS